MNPSRKIKLRLIVQLIVFYLVLILPIGNWEKTAIFVSLWTASFWPLTRAEFGLMLIVNAIFSVNNYLAIENGTFYFVNPDILGLPIYEFFLWGYYCLHLIRFHGISMPLGSWAKRIVLTVLFSLSFSLFPTQTGVLIATSSAFVLLLTFFHERADLKMAIHFILLGTVLEYLGVHFSQWGYAGNYSGGVAYWYINLFGGVGILCRQLMIPILVKLEHLANQEGSQ